MSKQLTLSKIKQLVDINENMVNFEIEFKITTKNNEPFEMAIVDQNTLNNNANLEYKKINGSISGTVKNDNGIFQTHFLVLKADNPCQCLVIFNKKEQLINNNNTSSTNESFVKKNFSYILLLVAVGVGIWFVFFGKTETTNSDLNDKSTQKKTNDSENRISFHEDVDKFISKKSEQSKVSGIRSLLKDDYSSKKQNLSEKPNSFNQPSDNLRSLRRPETLDRAVDNLRSLRRPETLDRAVDNLRSLRRPETSGRPSDNLRSLRQPETSGRPSDNLRSLRQPETSGRYENSIRQLPKIESNSIKPVSNQPSKPLKTNSLIEKLKDIPV